jgi:hypothetical protein
MKWGLRRLPRRSPWAKAGIIIIQKPKLRLGTPDEFNPELQMKFYYTYIFQSENEGGRWFQNNLNEVGHKV